MLGIAAAAAAVLLAAAAPAAADEASIRRELAQRVPRAELARKIAEPPIEVRGAGSVAGTVYRERVMGVVVVGGDQSLGTGALVTPQGDIVTNDHVARRAYRADGGEWVAIWFKPADGSEIDRDSFLTARVIKKDSRHDLAVVRLTQPLPRGSATIPLSGARPEVGADVFVIGHPRGLFWSLTQGIVSQLRPNYQWRAEDRIPHEANTIQTQAPINPGNSGGPLLDGKGEIVGIVSFSEGESQGLFFGIDAQHVRDLLARAPDAPDPGDGRAAGPRGPAGRIDNPPQPGKSPGPETSPNQGSDSSRTK
jgi:S1-C subfamily serine protease